MAKKDLEARFEAWGEKLARSGRLAKFPQLFRELGEDINDDDARARMWAAMKAVDTRRHKRGTYILSPLVRNSDPSKPIPRPLENLLRRLGMIRAGMSAQQAADEQCERAWRESGAQSASPRNSAASETAKKFRSTKRGVHAPAFDPVDRIDQCRECKRPFRVRESALAFVGTKEPEEISCPHCGYTYTQCSNGFFDTYPLSEEAEAEWRNDHEKA